MDVRGLERDPACWLALAANAILISTLGSFNAYATRFFSPSYGFALSWNYWFNDAVSVASDLTAAQLVLQYWTNWHTWVVSLIFWVFLVIVNAIHVRAYGELGMSEFSDCDVILVLNANHRVLAVLSQSYHCRSLHHSRYRRPCRREPAA